MSYRKILDKITWSFSSLTSYCDCPYEFYTRRIEREPEEENFYAENGTAMHETLASILNGEISVDDAPNVYADKYELICSKTSQSTMNKKFESCLDFLCVVEPPPENIEVIGVELKLNFKVGKYNFVGYADAVFRDKNTGEIWLVDHKSCTHFFGKNGQVLKSTANKFYSYKKQMYLYAYGLQEQLGIHVDHICWNHFCDGGALSIIPFKEEEMQDVIDWAVSVIESIYADKTFEPCDFRNNYMQCHQICGYRNDCLYLLERDEEGGE